jgi:hypothetical protein
MTGRVHRFLTSALIVYLFQIFPFVSADGQRQVVRQMLELCPTNKILWSSMSCLLSSSGCRSSSSYQPMVIGGQNRSIWEHSKPAMPFIRYSKLYFCCSRID